MLGTVALVLGYVESSAPSRATGYVEYLPGTGLNVILSAPHGGVEEPASIPDRDAGCWDGSQCIWSHTCGVKDPDQCGATTVRDVNTAELGRELRQSLCDRFNGLCPGLVVNLLHRVKLDANREINEATFGVQAAVDAYDEFQAYIADERASIGRPGLFVDVHGHGHDLQWAELGYLASAAELDSGDPVDPATTSIRSLASAVGGDFDQLLRGTGSFGDLLEAEGFEAVPSPSKPGPNGNPYFAGGYNTQTHGSMGGGVIDGIQIESPRSFRDPPLRDDYVIALTNTIANYLSTHYPPSGK